MPKRKKKRGKRKWVCLTTGRGDKPGYDDIPTPYSDPFDYALRKKRSLKRKKNPPRDPSRKYMYVYVVYTGKEHIGLEVTNAKELESAISGLKREGRFSTITGPFASRQAAKKVFERMR
jgi:hypothetical protein